MGVWGPNARRRGPQTAANCPEAPGDPDGIEPNHFLTNEGSSMRFCSTLCLIIVIAVIHSATGAGKPPITATNKKPVQSRYGPPKKGSLLSKFTLQPPETH